MTQTKKNFGFAAKPQIKSWQRADNALSDSDSDDSDVKVDDQAFDDADILDFCTWIHVVGQSPTVSSSD